jgi:hypothetical protein
MISLSLEAEREREREREREKRWNWEPTSLTLITQLGKKGKKKNREENPKYKKDDSDFAKNKIFSTTQIFLHCLPTLRNDQTQHNDNNNNARKRERERERERGTRAR